MVHLIIGNGVAGTTAAAAIRKTDHDSRIVMCSDEAYPFYSRIRLPEFLAGKISIDELIIRKDVWYQERRIEVLLNTPVTGVDSVSKTVLLNSGSVLHYDRLLLAAGGLSFIPPIPGSDKEGVFALRNLQDAVRIRDYISGSRKEILVIGGGILGLEAGYGLLAAGHGVTVAEFFPRLLPRQMDPEGAEILKDVMENMGFIFYLGAQSKEIIGAKRAEGLVLSDGRKIGCDMVLISAGVRPNLTLPRSIGLAVDRGVIVNDRMETSMPDIYAAGDLVQHAGTCYGIWPAAEKQGETAGINMAGGDASYRGTTISNMLKVAGLDLAAGGDIDAEAKKESVVFADRSRKIYKKIVLDNNTITGMILFNDMRDRLKIMRAIENRTDISLMLDSLRHWELAGLP